MSADRTMEEILGASSVRVALYKALSHLAGAGQFVSFLIGNLEKVEGLELDVETLGGIRRLLSQLSEEVSKLRFPSDL